MIKKILLTVILLSLFNGCSSSSKPADVRSEIWDKSEEIYTIFSNRFNSMEDPSDDEIQTLKKFSLLSTKFLESDVYKLSEDERTLLEYTTLFGNVYAGYWNAKYDGEIEKEKELIVHFTRLEKTLKDVFEGTEKLRDLKISKN
jgi:hypothetical protein